MYRQQMQSDDNTSLGPMGQVVGKKLGLGLWYLMPLSTIF